MTAGERQPLTTEQHAERVRAAIDVAERLRILEGLAFPEDTFLDARASLAFLLARLQTVEDALAPFAAYQAWRMSPGVTTQPPGFGPRELEAAYAALADVTARAAPSAWGDLWALIARADSYWWDGSSPDPEFAAIAVDMGVWCMEHRDLLGAITDTEPPATPASPGSPVVSGEET